MVLIIVGILLGAGFFIFDEFQNQIDNIDNTVDSENNTGIVGIAYLNSTGYTVADAGEPCFNNFVVTGISNRTDGGTIADTNYTVNANTGFVTNTTSITHTNVSISYTYNDGSSSCRGIEATTQAMLTIPELLGLIILIAVIGVILAVIFNVIPGAKVSGA